MKKHMLAKRMGAIALCAVLSTGLLSATAAAQGKDVTAYLSPDLSIVVDGSYRTFYNAVGQEVHPILYGGTTYLPIRAIGELMGKNVNWSQSTLTVSLAGDRPNGSVTGTPDSAAKAQTVQAAIRPDITILVDNVRQTFADANGDTVYPLLYSGSVYLPVRSIGELMDKEVNWNNATRTVTLSGGSLVTDADSFEDNNGNNNGNNNGGNNGGGGTSPSYSTNNYIPPSGSVVDFARSQIGVPYEWGGSTPNVGLDCSGLTSWCWQQATGIWIGRTDGAQYSSARWRGPLSEAQPGDVLWTSGHVGICTSAGGGSYIHAPQPGQTVCESSWPQFVCALRW